MDWPLGLLQQSSHLKLGFCFMCCDFGFAFVCIYSTGYNLKDEVVMQRTKENKYD